jgi:hypothetical protein
MILWTNTFEAARITSISHCTGLHKSLRVKYLHVNNILFPYLRMRAFLLIKFLSALQKLAHM